MGFAGLLSAALAMLPATLFATFLAVLFQNYWPTRSIPSPSALGPTVEDAKARLTLSCARVLLLPAPICHAESGGI